MDQQPTTPSTKGSRQPSTALVPRSVELAIRATWGLVLVMGVLVVLLAVFRDDVVGAWASGHEGAREVFDEGGREALERAGYAPPSFLPVAVTMLVVGAMLVWVLTAMLRRGYRWGQLGLFALMLFSAYVSIALGFVLAPPPVFVVLAVVALLVEGVVIVFLWHSDTREFLSGPWADGPDGPDEPSGTGGGAVGADGSRGSADRSA
ncbi:MAG TPA: hypothetical protein VH228_07470 [Nocardioides sp.]|nr:hypothetical protein [Nocardioides sp.]